MVGRPFVACCKTEVTSEKLNGTVHQIEKLVGQKDWAGVKAAAIRLRYLEGIARAAKTWLDDHRDSTS